MASTFRSSIASTSSQVSDGPEDSTLLAFEEMIAEHLRVIQSHKHSGRARFTLEQYSESLLGFSEAVSRRRANPQTTSNNSVLEAELVKLYDDLRLHLRDVTTKLRTSNQDLSFLEGLRPALVDFTGRHVGLDASGSRRKVFHAGVIHQELPPLFMDPLSVAASITGLLAVGGKLTALLAQIGRLADAPALCRTALTELSETKSVLRQISALVDGGLRSIPVGSRQNVLLEHVAAALVGFVMTKDELEAALDDLGLVYADSGIITGSFDRLRWVRREGEIESLMGRLHNHKASLGLILVTLQCTALSQAQESIDRQCELFEAIVSTNAALSTRLSRLEGKTAVGDANTASLATTECPPPPTDDSDDGRTDREQPDRIASASQNYREAVAFEIELQKSRVYRRMLILAESATADAHSETSMTTTRRRGAAASIFSALSLADISNLSQFSLPILIQEIGNNQWYVESKVLLYHIGSPLANYDIRWPTPGSVHSVTNQRSEITLGYKGKPIVLGYKDNPIALGYTYKLPLIRGRSGTFVEWFAYLKTAHIVLYNTASHRAWFTNGLHALAHLLRASLRHDINSGPAGEYLFDPALLEEHPNPSDPSAVSYFLTNRNNLELPICWNTSSNAGSEEAAVRGPQADNVVVAASTVVRLRHRIDQLLGILMDLIDRQLEESIVVNISSRAPENRLEGYQFMDIATRCVPAPDAGGPRKYMVQGAEKSWVKFVRRIHAVTLFGEGFGDLVAPAIDCSAECVHREIVAEGQNHLVVASYDLLDIIRRYGRATDPAAFELIPGIFWKKSARFETADDNEMANDEDIGQRHCDSIHVLSPAQPWGHTKGSQQSTASEIVPEGVYMLEGSNARTQAARAGAAVLRPSPQNATKKKKPPPGLLSTIKETAEPPETGQHPQPEGRAEPGQPEQHAEPEQRAESDHLVDPEQRAEPEGVEHLVDPEQHAEPEQNVELEELVETGQRAEPSVSVENPPRRIQRLWLMVRKPGERLATTLHR
ncbi:hypothetical protein QBC47DRAFT_427482 [Echria macrotheca]|uniref:Uncharacterized protein n=1 Tax=Echria macrotheca TaxID=438768 RepID=A0AAJ0BL94_9PEZI|nr:hypothetical protein QBC47DRAFT_427482 [Echria macrotheca]